MEINYKQYAYFQDRFEIDKYQPQQFGHGVWYEPEIETYSEAIDRAKKDLYDKVYTLYPFLRNAVIITHKEPEELPSIDINEM